MPDFDVSVIIPNWNGRELMEKNLPGVIAAKRNPKNRIREIIIVDDYSTDDSVDFLKKYYKDEIKLVVHKENRRFAAAVNTGARSAKGKLLVLFNTDVVPDENFLESAISFFADDKVFAVSLKEKGFGGWARGKIANGFVVFDPGRDATTAHLSFWASGGSAVFRRDYWMSLGGMDEKLFSPFYWEDIDISYRAYKRGWIIWWDPKSQVTHEHESTNIKLAKRWRSRIQERNQLLFIWKNIASTRLFRKHIGGLFKRLLRHPGYLVIFFMALGKLRTVRRLRGKEKKEAKVSDEAVFDIFDR